MWWRFSSPKGWLFKPKGLALLIAQVAAKRRPGCACPHNLALKGRLFGTDDKDTTVNESRRDV